MEMVVQNEEGIPTVIGEEGELMVKGSMVTKGYYLDPKNTKEDFLNSPADCHMVKSAGGRIEILAIEHVVCRFESIEEAVVMPAFKNEKDNMSPHGFVKLKENENFYII